VIRSLAAWSGVLTIAAAAPVAAQTRPSVGVEAASDEVRRGLSWSGGRAAVSADAAATLGPVDALARVATTRGSARHGGADAAVDLTLGTGTDWGAFQLRATATGHLFAGARGDMDYVEAGGSGTVSYGPARLTAGASYAPAQDAIGGSNLFVYAAADAGIPGTPLTVSAEIGHSSGQVDDQLRAQRLRPGGDYANWRLGIERRRGPLTLALDYLGTDIDRRNAIGPFADARHAGERIVARVRFAL